MNLPVEALKLRSGYRLQFERSQESWVLLFPEGMVQLNPSAGMILQAFLKPSTIEKVVSELQGCFPAMDIREDIRSFVQEAYDQRWLDVTG